jgi:hypothetical protein
MTTFDKQTSAMAEVNQENPTYDSWWKMFRREKLPFILIFICSLT